MPEPFWIAVRTHPNCESVAIRHLQNQSFDYYQPLIAERKRIPKGWKDIKLPLFPCYLFVEIKSRWLCLESTHGIAYVLKNGTIPAQVRQLEIDKLRACENSVGLIELPKQRWKDGDTVKIKDGVFTNQLATVIRASVKDRQRFLLELVFGETKLKIEAHQSQLSAVG